ncbi:HAD-IIIA family hydrolase [Sinomonas sp. R1AF57]|uniref:D-glycero-alpha-D-manno-heptose-1,7-bisphosphate 7-phosphatase n=1 Tax=Sinomonas sp. R1AF57 TaxID=2020377 RepID=UPI000B61EF7D|nr:HAD family hydrolase [Sinomonas sp. R1AF57]ASN51030.1 haloacid dehalogenase [Sinomonas sp. R1AF57]
MENRRRNTAGHARTRGPRRPWIPRAVLFDRDGTLVHDVPYNRDPRLVRPMPDAARVLDELREAGIPTGVVSNQSGVGLGIISPDELDAVNARVEELLGPFDTWQVCPHGPDGRCRCRKPQPGLILAACAALGVAPSDALVIGDIGKDMEAARRAGARGVLVPTRVTRRQEVLEAPAVAGDLTSAIILAFGSRELVASEPLATGTGGAQ